MIIGAIIYVVVVSALMAIDLINAPELPDNF
jgi:hypothetical protein